MRLDLSHNNICEDGATYMGKAIAANDTLEELDLSWNSIRRKGAVTICKALKVLIGCCLHYHYITAGIMFWRCSVFHYNDNMRMYFQLVSVKT